MRIYPHNRAVTKIEVELGRIPMKIRRYAMGKKAMMVLGVLWAMVFVVGPVFAAGVPDSGVTQCYDDAGNVITCPSPGQRFYGQDGNYSINPPSYTKPDSNGNALLNSAPHWFMGGEEIGCHRWTFRVHEMHRRQERKCDLRSVCLMCGGTQ